MTEEPETKNTNKPSGIQWVALTLVVVGFFLTLFVAGIIGLPLLFIGAILNIIGAVKKQKVAQPETPES